MHILMTSRPESDIQLSIESWASPDEMFSIQGAGVNKDIDDYIHDAVMADERSERWHGRPETQREITAHISAKAGGMYVAHRYVISSLLKYTGSAGFRAN